MPLYHIQDDDRPAYVFAKNFTDALHQYEAAIAHENDGDACGPPKGIIHICDDIDVIVDGTFKA